MLQDVAQQKSAYFIWVRLNLFGGTAKEYNVDGGDDEDEDEGDDDNL